MSTLARQGLTRRALGLVAALALLALASLALAPAPLAAISGSGSGCLASNATTIYFSDFGRTTVVGSYYADCDGVCTGSGSITGIYEIAHTNVLCPDGDS